MLDKHFRIISDIIFGLSPPFGLSCRLWFLTSAIGRSFTLSSCCFFGGSQRFCGDLLSMGSFLIGDLVVWPLHMDCLLLLEELVHVWFSFPCLSFGSVIDIVSDLAALSSVWERDSSLTGLGLLCGLKLLPPADCSSFILEDDMYTASWYKSCLKCTTCSSSLTISSSSTATSARSPSV
ncbi:hypothetical protein V8G54_008910 [Vigna mungo]|uniref:Uncharacterized protein n=1 Tax=Vigna mungo TaxID=3915 RepID=A0AAQ3S9M0_VIGMU